MSDAHQAFVDEEVAAGRYVDAEACVVAAVQDAARRRAQERLETLLLEGVESEELEWTPALLDEIRRDAGLTA